MADRWSCGTISGTAIASLRTSLPVARERTTRMNTIKPLDPTVWHWLIHSGMAVYAAGGELVGTVTEVGPANLTVTWRGSVMAIYYIPTGAVADVGAREVHLTIPMDQVVNQDEDRLPTDGDAAADAEALVTGRAARTDDEGGGGGWGGP